MKFHYILTLLLLVNTFSRVKTSCSCNSNNVNESPPSNCLYDPITVQNWDLYCSCHRGYYKSYYNNNGWPDYECAACPVGTYKEYNGNSACIACGEGKVSSATAAIYHDVCTACPAHTYPNDENSGCNPNQCSAGSTGPDLAGPCVGCATGKYKTDKGSALCSACPDNSISPSSSVALAACVCKAGYTGPDGGTCTFCPTGNYKTDTGSAVCTQCGAGKYSGAQAATAASTCTSCPDFSGCLSTACTTSLGCACNAGYTGPNAGPCTGCVAGKYKIAVGTAACSDCSTSSISPVNSTVLAACVCNAGYTGIAGGPCAQCARGTYKTAAVTAACTSCAAGSYSPDLGATTCASCPSNSGASCIGCSALGSCTCNVGFTTSSGNCTACIAGKYKALTGSATCSTCPTSSGASCSGCNALTQCKCNAGFYGWSGGTCSTCLANSGASCDGCTTVFQCQCNPGYYGVGGGNCINCPLNSGEKCNGCTTLNQCQCNAGYVGADGSACKSCGMGTYRQLQQTSCTNCSAGTYSSIAAASTCTTCPTNSGTPGPGNSNVSVCTCNPGHTGPNGLPCSKCVELTYKATPGPAACIPCADPRMASNTQGTGCYICGPGSQPEGALCVSCDVGKYSKDETMWRCVTCKSGFYTLTTGSDKCEPCHACPDGFYRDNCTPALGGGSCLPCAACPSGHVNVGCMNRAGHTDRPGVCRAREYTVRTPQCDEENEGFGLGGYKFLDIFGVAQDDAVFQCRHRCDGDQNAMTGTMYKSMAPTTRDELVRAFGDNRTFNGGACNGPYACDVSSCVIFGSNDDTQQSFMQDAACPVFVDSNMASDFWAALERNSNDEIVGIVKAMRGAQCQGCDECGRNEKPISDWGRGCARECTQIKCPYQQIYDWTEPDGMKKCKRCEDLADRRLCKSSERTLFQNNDVSGRLPKFYMEGCFPKMQNAQRDYETTYGSCRQCSDSTNACGAQTDYYHSCQRNSNRIDDTNLQAQCRTCIRPKSVQQENRQSTYYDGQNSQTLYCQQTPCAPRGGLAYTGISIDVQPQLTCYTECLEKSCSPAEIELPCVLPHQKRCRPAVAIDRGVTDVLYATVRHAPAHVNVLEPATDALHLFSSFENTLVDHDTSGLYQRAQCVWNADHILDNSMNPAGISQKFQDDCRPWTRDPRVVYPLMPLQNTVTDTSAGFARRVLLNTSAHAVSYKRTSEPDVSAERQVSPPADAFAADTYLELDLTGTTNATLAAFVPDDRNIDSVEWVPRWRVAVHARQISGGDVKVVVSTDSEETCVSCFLLTLK